MGAFGREIYEMVQDQVSAQNDAFPIDPTPWDMPEEQAPKPQAREKRAARKVRLSLMMSAGAKGGGVNNSRPHIDVEDIAH